jgi:hypothetical protein
MQTEEERLFKLVSTATDAEGTLQELLSAEKKKEIKEAHSLCCNGGNRDFFNNYYLEEGTSQVSSVMEACSI